MRQFIVILGMFVSTVMFAQDEVETVRLVKQQEVVYRGVEQEIRDWYVYMDAGGVVLLANLSIPAQEVAAWFEKRKDSQSLYRGRITGLGIQTLVLRRNESVEDQLTFYVREKGGQQVVFQSMEDGIVYTFNRVE